MPHFNKFINGFNIYKGRKMNSLVIDNYSGYENTISKYHEYKYDITVKYKVLDNLNINDLNQLDLSSRIIYSEYGNPYSCTLVELERKVQGNLLIVRYLGKSYRV